MMSAAQQTATGTGLAGVLGAVDELIEVIEAENVALARGMPASLSRSTERKLSLAAILAAAQSDIAAREAVRSLPPETKERLAERIVVAQRAIAENETRLTAAMQASRRRIAAVMAAVRDEAQRAEAPAYGANGRRAHVAAAGLVSRGRVI